MMMKGRMKKVILATMLIWGFGEVLAKDFTNEQYRTAAWMATRFYGGQRSGNSVNWLSAQSGRTTSFVKDSYAGDDISGGWFDCGDHVMFGQTQYYSAYALLKAYDAFPKGFHDLYSANYEGFLANDNFSYGYGAANGVPDIIDELKFEMDFIIKATHPDYFVFQKGNGNYDHMSWKTPASMSLNKITEGGEKEGSRPIFVNPNGGSMAAFAAAALALAARVMEPFYGADYVAILKGHALTAYKYAESNVGTAGAETGNFYQANVEYKDDIGIAAAEMYRTFGDDKYLDVIDDNVWTLNEHGWALNYNNNNDLAKFAALQATDDLN